MTSRQRNVRKKLRWMKRNNTYSVIFKAHAKHYPINYKQNQIKKTCLSLKYPAVGQPDSYSFLNIRGNQF